jgi:DNA topoisomerase IB
MVSFEQLSYEKQSESERATPAVKNKKKVDFTQFLKSLRLQLGTFLICGRDENEPIRVS